MIRVRVLSLDNELLEEGEIDTFPFVVGRGADCDLCLDKHGISRRHLEIVDLPEGIVIHDLKSTNGTFVDGRRIDQLRLKRSAKIRLGPYYVEIENPDYKSDGTTGIIDIKELSKVTDLNESEEEPSVEEIIAAKPALSPAVIRAQAEAAKIRAEADAEAAKAARVEVEKARAEAARSRAEAQAAKARAATEAEEARKARAEAEVAKAARVALEVEAARAARAEAQAVKLAQAQAEAEARTAELARMEAEIARADAEADQNEYEFPRNTPNKKLLDALSAVKKPRAALPPPTKESFKENAKPTQTHSRLRAAEVPETKSPRTNDNIAARARADELNSLKAKTEALKAKVEENLAPKIPKSPTKEPTKASDKGEMFRNQRPTSLPPRPGQTATRKEEPLELPQPFDDSDKTAVDKIVDKNGDNSDFELAEAQPSIARKKPADLAAAFAAVDETLPLEDAPAINMFNSPTEIPSLSVEPTALKIAPPPRSAFAAGTPAYATPVAEVPRRLMERWLDWKIGLVLQILPVGTAFVLEDPPFEIVSNYAAIFLISLTLAAVFSLVAKAKQSEWDFKLHFLLSFYMTSVAVPCSILLRIYRAANPNENQVYLGLGVFQAIIWSALVVLLGQWSLRYARKGVIASLFLVAPLAAYLILPVLHAVDPQFLPTEPKLVELISAEFSKRHIQSTDAFLNQIDDDYKTLEVERAPASKRR